MHLCPGDREVHDGHDPTSATSATSATAPATDTRSPFPPLAWVALLLGGHGMVLLIAIFTAATTVQHHWWFAATATLALLTRLVPDALELTEWACGGAPTWLPPVDPRPRLAVALAALASRAPDYPELARLAPMVEGWLPPRTARSHLATVIVALGLAVLVAAWAGLAAPTP
jgi:hypothetical protein